MQIVIHLTEADQKVMQDYLDVLAEKCETERFIIWNHPTHTIESQPDLEEI